VFWKRELERYLGRAKSSWKVNIKTDFMEIVWGGKCEMD
jgi:hypothetical protein